MEPTRISMGQGRKTWSRNSIVSSTVVSSLLTGCNSAREDILQIIRKILAARYRRSRISFDNVRPDAEDVLGDWLLYVLNNPHANVAEYEKALRASIDKIALPYRPKRKISVRSASSLSSLADLARFASGDVVSEIAPETPEIPTLYECLMLTATLLLAAVRRVRRFNPRAFPGVARYVNNLLRRQPKELPIWQAARARTALRKALEKECELRLENARGDERYAIEHLRSLLAESAGRRGERDFMKLVELAIRSKKLKMN